jgi:hypothetical protein
VHVFNFLLARKHSRAISLARCLRSVALFFRLARCSGVIIFQRWPGQS